MYKLFCFQIAQPAEDLMKQFQEITKHKLSVIAKFSHVVQNTLTFHAVIVII